MIGDEDEGESGRKREKTSRKYISSEHEDVQRLEGRRKDCKMNLLARCEEKLRTDNHCHSFHCKLPNQERKRLPRFLSVYFLK